MQDLYHQPQHPLKAQSHGSRNPLKSFHVPEGRVTSDLYLAPTLYPKPYNYGLGFRVSPIEGRVITGFYLAPTLWLQRSEVTPPIAPRSVRGQARSILYGLLTHIPTGPWGI